LLADEGINGTVAGAAEPMLEFKRELSAIVYFAGLSFKDSTADRPPFRRLAVQIRDEIVTLKSGIKIPKIKPENRLSPTEWNEMIVNRGESVTILDTRNTYETQMGKFRGAVDPRIKAFGEFPDYVRRSGIPKDKPVLMYCTGGIRCEKAIEEMYAQGYSEVYQLDGGILKYLEEYPDHQFDGECFVFDHRVAVDQRLQPTTRYRLCPHCGDPGTVTIQCGYCSQSTMICAECNGHEHKKSCSKNCTYHLSKSHVRKERLRKGRKVAASSFAEKRA
jgi:UPF0176 protein